MIDRDFIETPENVELERRLAGIGSRFIAGLVDTLILVGAWLVLLVALLIFSLAGFGDASLFQEVLGTWILALMIAAGFLLYWGYFVFFEMFYNGQSPGKRAVKIRVVRMDGAPISFIPVAIRNLLRVVDGIGLYGVAGVVMFVTKRIQRLGDLAAGTVVISEQVPDYSRQTDKRSRIMVEPEVPPAGLRASGLTPREYRLLRNYWQRRTLLQFDARARLARKLVQPILERMGRSLGTMHLEACETFMYEMLSSAAGSEGRGAAPSKAYARDKAVEEAAAALDEAASSRSSSSPAEASPTEEDDESRPVS